MATIQLLNWTCEKVCHKRMFGLLNCLSLFSVMPYLDVHFMNLLAFETFFISGFCKPLQYKETYRFSIVVRTLYLADVFVFFFSFLMADLHDFRCVSMGKVWWKWGQMIRLHGFYNARAMSLYRKKKQQRPAAELTGTRLGTLCVYPSLQRTLTLNSLILRQTKSP